MKSKLRKFMRDNKAHRQESRASMPYKNLTALEQEFLPPLLEIQDTPPSPYKRKVALSIVGLVALLLTWSYFGEIDVASTASGKFIPDGKVKVIQPLENAIVRAIHVVEGQKIRQGDLLLELDPTSSTADLTANTEKFALNQLESDRLLAELDHTQPNYHQPDKFKSIVVLQEQLRRAREATYANKVAQAQLFIREKIDILAAGEATLNKLKETAAIAKEREESARPLVKTGALSRLDYLQLKQDLVSNENDLMAQSKMVEQEKHAKQGAEKKLAEVRHDNQASILTDIDTHANDQTAIQGNVTKSKQIYDQHWLRSPVDGLVQSVNVATVGGVVTPAQPLITIVPNGTPLIVEASLSNDDIGFVRVGQKVEIKIDTFPFQKYGTIPGRLVLVSPDAEDTANATTSPDNESGRSNQGNQSNSSAGKSGKVTYKVHIKPDRLTVNVDGKLVPITSGMTLQADITTDHRRVIEFFLSPVIKYLDEGLKVR